MTAPIVWDARRNYLLYKTMVGATGQLDNGDHSNRKWKAAASVKIAKVVMKRETIVRFVTKLMTTMAQRTLSVVMFVKIGYMLTAMGSRKTI